MFTIFGAVLVLFGLMCGSELYEQRPIHVNINLYWGLVLLLFGGAMLVLVARSKNTPQDR
jgi:hypothetical protein